MRITSGTTSTVGSSTSHSCSIGQHFGFRLTVLPPKVFIFVRHLRRRAVGYMACAVIMRLSKRYKTFFKLTIFYYVIVITYKAHRGLGSSFSRLPHHFASRCGLGYTHPTV